jgi:DnaJ-class molecular chaperone
MPRRSGRGFGDLFITFEVDFPDVITPDQKKKLREILGSTGSKSSGSTGNSEL